MIAKINIEEFLLKSEKTPVIDVRSPAEFKQGHIPGVINLPLFDNEERAMIGTIYKKSGRDAAFLKGLELAGPKLADFVKRVHQVALQKEIMFHCWRGGMRSEQMGWLLDQAGFKTAVLEGGYKSYRRYIRARLAENANIIILGGLTGSGKTDILHQLEKSGEQVLDLEMLSNHKGSVFGALGQEPQPTTEQFENDIYHKWRSFDLKKRIWIEDESRSIGSVNIPDPLIERMSRAPMIMIGINLKQRVNRLVNEYSGFSEEQLKEAVSKISEKLGGAKTIEAIRALDERNFKKVAEIVLTYYDKAYLYAVNRRENKDIIRPEYEKDDPEAFSKILIPIVKEIFEG